MSRNNVRGPTSALTEFLKVSQHHILEFDQECLKDRLQASGITATSIARRNATRDREPVAGPSGTRENGNADAHQQGDRVVDATEPSPRRRTRAAAVCFAIS